MPPIEKRQARAKLLIVFATLSLAFGLWEGYRRSELVVDGTVTAIGAPRAGASWFSGTPGVVYKMTSPSGEAFDFAVDGTDASLPRDLPVGTHVVKARGEISWRRNDVVVSDFPLIAYLGLPLVLFTFGVWNWLRYRGTPSGSPRE